MEILVTGGAGEVECAGADKSFAFVFHRTYILISITK